jgi:hypothetical protein
MNLEFKIIESNSEIRNLILNAMKEHLNIVFSKAVNEIIVEVKNIVSEALKKEPEYESLISGTLRYEFGIPDTGAVDNVIEEMVNTLNLQYKPITQNNLGLSGGYVLTMIKSDDINGIINSQSAKVVDGTRGYELPWLNWLLFQSNKPIVKNYEVKIGPNPSSRTGMAVMVDSNKNWRVPPEFAGTISNNWTTRAIEKTENRILKAMQTYVEKYI